MPLLIKPRELGQPLCYRLLDFPVMDPLSAIGIASAVAQFLDVGFKIGKRLAEYNKASPNEVPRSLQSINTQLPLLVNALQRVKTDVEVNKFDFDTQCILKGVISGCVNLVEEVESILNKVAKAPGESLTSKLRKSFASFKHDEKILAIDKSLQTYINVLILHHVIDGEDVSGGLLEESSYYEVREKRADPFADRDDKLEKLDELFRDVLKSHTKRPTLVVMIGDRGVGKTQLALEYCRQSHGLGRFKTVFWLDGKSPESFILSMESTAAVIRHSTEGTRTEKVDFVTSFLCDRWHPWLLVVDGYDHKSFDGIDLEQSLPKSGYGAILFTTTFKSAYVLGKVLEVPKYLTEEEKRSLKWSLQCAIEKSSVEDVKRCIARGAIVNELDINDWPHISRAAVYGDPAVFKILLDNGADPNFRRGLKEPPICFAASKSLEIVTMLLDHEDAQGERQEPEVYERSMRQALKEGEEDIAHALLSRRTFNLRSKDQYGASMLRLAVQGGSATLVKLLLDREATPMEDSEKGEVLVAAVEAEQESLLRTLLSSRGFHADLKNIYGNTALHGAVELPDDPDLSWSSSKASGLSRTALLLQAGADPNAKGGSNNSTPLHGAALRESSKKLRLLLDHGGDVALEDGSGYNALLVAAKYNSPSVYPMLLAHPMPDPATRTEFLNKALQYGARNGNRELILATLRSSASSGSGAVDVNHVDWAGKTPLLLALDGGHVDTARMLLRQKAKPNFNVPDQQGRLPLLVAAERGYETIVREMLKQGGNVEQRDEKEDTALCLAAAKGHEKVVKVLLDAGADPEEGNRYGDLPVDLAEQGGWKEVVKMLEEEGAEKV